VGRDVEWSLTYLGLKHVLETKDGGLAIRFECPVTGYGDIEVRLNREEYEFLLMCCEMFIGEDISAIESKQSLLDSITDWSEAPLNLFEVTDQQRPINARIKTNDRFIEEQLDV